MYKISNPLGMHRRQCFALICAPLVAQLTACASTDEIPVVNLNPEKIKNLSDLVREIKQAAGNRAPKDVSTNEIYSTLADAFVKYAQEAINLGTKIPEEITRRLPLKKKVVAPLLAVPAMMIFTLWNIQFVIPIALFFDVILGSLVLMLAFIVAALKDEPKKGAGKSLKIT